MSDGLVFQVSVNDESLKARLAGYPARLQASVLRVVQRLAIEVQRSVKSDKLSGQALHVRTGTLRRSINQEVTASGGAVTAVVGTNVRYAKVHEFGFDGNVSVKAHVRRNAQQLKAALRTRKDGSAYYSRNGMRDGSVPVRAHTRHMVVPERSFLRSTLREFKPKIVAEIEAAAKEAWDGS